MKEIIVGWRHVFKLDPDRVISDEALQLLCQSGTDAVLVGGSSGITYENTIDLLRRIRKYNLPCILEISSQAAVVPGFDLYFIPIVLNAEDAQWIVGQQHQAVKSFDTLIPWDRVVTEGYVVLNEQSTVAALTKANTALEISDLLAYARMADQMFRLPVFYIEYSGSFGNMEWVEEAKGLLQHSRLFYGGGIDSPDKARQAAKAADTIVVGNIIYDNLQQALETVDFGGSIRSET